MNSARIRGLNGDVLLSLEKRRCVTGKFTKVISLRAIRKIRALKTLPWGTPSWIRRGSIFSN